MKDGKDMKGAERRKPEAVRRRTPSEKPRTACDTVFSVPQAAPDSRASYFSSKTAEPLMSADEAPTSASNTPFSATHSPFVSS